MYMFQISQPKKEQPKKNGLEKPPKKIKEEKEKEIITGKQLVPYNF